MTATILLVDDEPNYRLVIGQLLESRGYDVVEAASGREALDLFRERPETDLVMTDITMPDGDGMELLTKVKEERPEVPVVMLTAHNDAKLAVEAIKKGAFDYLTKPYHNEDLLRCAAKALEVSSLARQNKELRAALMERHSFGSLIGKSKPMNELYRLLEKVAPTKANVLITGESGTGKELVARAVHHNGPRCDRPFVAVNCSALSETLLVSELFGHEKGAFTGAVSARAGRFELADKGTLFLDEIGEISPATQVALLRVLQERTVERVGGGGRPVEADVRLITATNKDLKAEVAAGRFREDLFYRLNVVHIKLPPLRERLEDLPILAARFLEKFGRDRPARPVLNPETLRLLYAYHWPGNIRELENVVERGLVLASGDEILPEDLPEELRRPQGGAGSGAGAGPGAGPAAGPTPGARGGRAAGPAPGKTAADARAPAGPGGSPPPAGGTVFGGGVPSPAGRRPEDWMEEAIALLPDGMTLPEALSGLEEALLRKAMDMGGGVQNRAADFLGLRRNVFKYKWDKYAGVPATPVSDILFEAAPPGGDLPAIMAGFEEELLRRALAMAKGSQSLAADFLGLRRNVIPYKLKKYPGLLS
ncbi:MAG: sigma 54-interacting transcriptional regulator [Deltaproteobacteria bacterium]|jgi:two-component system NtrC family response regulator|nr:sigma 54-interacting transcriptional regulator [Deltaproteobacteria bacterium]